MKSSTRRSFCLTVACGSKTFGANTLNFRFDCLQIGAKFRIGMKSGYRGRSCDSAPLHIGVPMMVANVAVLAKSPAPGKDRIGLVR